MEYTDVVVVGGGQAGLAMSRQLVDRGVDHVVFERDTVGHEWADRRWESFCLVTPNWQCDLPGFPYAGGDPDGFMLRDEIVAFLRAYRASFDPPVREGVAVTSVRRAADGGFDLTTSAGEWHASSVVVATGGYHTPRLPRLADRLPAGVVSVHSSAYRSPEALPPGAVLVVGTGQSGAQIVEDLHVAGRDVHVAVGSAPRVARRHRGQDVMKWLFDNGYYGMPVHEHSQGERVRLQANHYVTGRDGGHDLDLRAFARDGVTLHGRLLDVEDGRARFAGDLAANLDHADDVYNGINANIDGWIAAQGIDVPAAEPYRPVWHPPVDQPAELDLVAAGIGAVVWSTGYTRDYGWIEVPAFTGRGYPQHLRGVSSQPGLFFLGLPWLWTWGSGRFLAVADDSAFLADRIVASERVAAA
ncbi:MSMEG_0569 family flavin-dependent oxidoreductase [Jatrophihabitans sp. YIM 134969]